jgi:hypothetical protein
MLNLNEKTPHTVRNILARDQPLTETDIWRHTTFSRKRHPWPCGIRNWNPNLKLTILISNFDYLSFSNRRSHLQTNKVYYVATAPIELQSSRWVASRQV